MLLPEAQIQAELALAPLAPVSAPRAINLTAAEQESFVFRADLGENGSIIAKVAAPGRLAAQFASLQNAHPQLQTGMFRVPEPISYNPTSGVLLLEDVWGRASQSLWVNGAKGPARVLAAAGGWLARYHNLSANRVAFNPDPHLNWLGKSLAAHQQGARRIPMVTALTAHLADLQIRAERSRAVTSRRCITHRDFHMRNLLIRKNNRCYGIDMENAARDEAMRDLLFFLADSARATPEPPTPDALHRTATDLRRAYGQSPADPAARLFFQRAFALNLWAGQDISAAQLSDQKQRSLQTAQAILACDDLFADPA